MNTENLNGILAQYVQHCKARAAADEGTVWRAVDCFGVNWDIEDSDFPAMFADAMQQAQPTLDNPALQPIGGLQNLMLRDSEVEFVRECFRWLYNEDGGDISKRRGRAELFADQINGRFRRVFPRMSKYTMNTANAVFFLNLWEPHANYFYQAGEAKAWADYFGYEADFGGGTALDLPRYYTMCNDLLHALENYPEIIALHKAYAEQELGGIDDALHLLVYDILHTAYAEQFYPKGYTRGSTSRERAKAVKEKADRAELCIRIGECEQELQELMANPAALPDLTGCKINHKNVRRRHGPARRGPVHGHRLQRHAEKVQLHSLDEQWLSLRRGPQRRSPPAGLPGLQQGQGPPGEGTEEPEGGIGEAVIGNRPSGRMLFARLRSAIKNPCV